MGVTTKKFGTAVMAVSFEQFCKLGKGGEK